MGKHEAGYDYTRYRKLLAEAVDEKKRLELIDLMIKEKARDRLQEERMSDRVAMTTASVARILGPGPSEALWPYCVGFSGPWRA